MQRPRASRVIFFPFSLHFSVGGSSFEVSSCRFTCFGQSSHSWKVSENSWSDVDVGNCEVWCKTSLPPSSVHCESALFAVRARTFLLTRILRATTFEPVVFRHPCVSRVLGKSFLSLEEMSLLPELNPQSELLQCRIRRQGRCRGSSWNRTAR